MWKAQFTATIRQDPLQRQGQARKGKLVVSAALVLALVSALSGVSLSPSALQFSTMRVGVGSEVQKLKLTNRGSNDFRPERIEVKGSAAGDFVVDRTTCAVVPSGQSCFFLVQYRPQLPGTRRAQMVLSSSDGKQLEAALSGTATPGALEISPAALNFDTTPPGAKSATGQVTLASGGAFHVRRMYLQGDSAHFSEEADSCNGSSGGLKSCVISVRFEPRSEGNWNAHLVIDDDAVGSPHIVQLSGVSLKPVPTPTPISGLAPQALPAPPPAPPVNTVSTRPVQPPPSTGPAPPAAQPEPGIPVPPVRLPPVRGPQPAPAIPTFPIIGISPKSLDLSTNPVQHVTVTNYGSAPLEIGVRLIGQDAQLFGVNTGACRSLISPGRRCVIPVFYSSAESVRQKTYYSAQLQIAHNANNLGPQYVSLRWQGAVPARPHLITKPTALDFSRFYQIVQMRISTPAAPHLLLTMVNDGQVDLRQLNLRFGSSSTGAFSHTRDCRQLSRGQDCTERVFFRPRTRGNHSDRLYIFEGTQQLAAVDLTASMPAPPPPTNGNYGTDGSVVPKPSPGSKLGSIFQNPGVVNDTTVFNNPTLRKSPPLRNSGIVKAGHDITVSQNPPTGLGAGRLPKNAGQANRVPVSRAPTMQTNVPSAKVRNSQRVATPPPPPAPR